MEQWPREWDLSGCLLQLLRKSSAEWWKLTSASDTAVSAESHMGRHTRIVVFLFFIIWARCQKLLILRKKHPQTFFRATTAASTTTTTTTTTTTSHEAARLIVTDCHQENKLLQFWHVLRFYRQLGFLGTTLKNTLCSNPKPRKIQILIEPIRRMWPR